MPRPFRHVFGAFAGGQNTMKHVATLMSGSPEGAPEEGARVVGADLRGDSLKGLYGPGTAVTTLATGKDFIHYQATAGWIAKDSASTRKNWACRVSATVSILTDINAGVVSLPKYYDSATAYALGLVAPTVAPTSSAAAGTAATYAYTWVQEVGGVNVLESNPMESATQYAAGGTITATFAAADSRVTHAYVYRTQTGDPTGIKYYMGKIASPATTIADATPDTAIPLDWAPGGNVDDDLTPGDHSPAGYITVLSNEMHGGENNVDGNQSGMLFYAIDETLGWTPPGLLQYFPTLNVYRMPDRIEAIVSRQATSYAFTPSGIWAAVGATDAVVQVAKTPAEYGVPRGWGRTVVSTAKGIIYLSNEGVTLFDGLNSLVLTAGIIHPNIFRQSTNWHGAYYDDYYFLSNGSSLCYVIDCQAIPRVRLIETALPDTLITDWLNIEAMIVVPVITGGPDPGLYVYNTYTGTVKPWRPDDKTRVTGAAQFAAQWKTGELGFGDINRDKRLDRLRLTGKGTCTVKFYVDAYENNGQGYNDSALSLVHTVTATLPMLRSQMLPATLKGRRFNVVFDVPAASELYFGGWIEGLTRDG